ncbi:hypothetical protein [Paenibacillus hexagrammi]|uniref:Chemotaxis protein CheA P2 response regulator-binding domain-containing protein n=1 Tax=Paenibacillus hexagrammi TaxID=2908839 RepID=A0ABY3SBK9_9BACL|nr:hypothetical protein [Paenibacillus sp. YPD9-1]UJF31368.1 hypothetical protein L0M14_16150 [Paenibacillus sp. YPD9-1]
MDQLLNQSAHVNTTEQSRIQSGINPLWDMNEEEIQRILQAMQQGEQLYAIHIRLRDDLPLPLARMHVIMNECHALGKVANTHPSIDDLEMNASELQILLTSSLKDSEIRERVFLDSDISSYTIELLDSFPLMEQDPTINEADRIAEQTSKSLPTKQQTAPDKKE